jgi:hypothetical protein
VGERATGVSMSRSVNERSRLRQTGRNEMASTKKVGEVDYGGSQWMLRSIRNHPHPQRGHGVPPAQGDRRA